MNKSETQKYVQSLQKEIEELEKQVAELEFELSIKDNLLKIKNGLCKYNLWGELTAIEIAEKLIKDGLFVSELEEIAEHLLVYCNHNSDNAED